MAAINWEKRSDLSGDVYWANGDIVHEKRFALMENTLLCREFSKNHDEEETVFYVYPAGKPYKTIQGLLKSLKDDKD